MTTTSTPTSSRGTDGLNVVKFYGQDHHNNNTNRTRVGCLTVRNWLASTAVRADRSRSPIRNDGLHRDRVGGNRAGCRTVASSLDSTTVRADRSPIRNDGCLTFGEVEFSNYSISEIYASVTECLNNDLYCSVSDYSKHTDYEPHFANNPDGYCVSFPSIDDFLPHQSIDYHASSGYCFSPPSGPGVLPHFGAGNTETSVGYNFPTPCDAGFLPQFGNPEASGGYCFSTPSGSGVSPHFGAGNTETSVGYNFPTVAFRIII